MRLEKGEKAFNDALDSWYERTDEKQWIADLNQTVNKEKIDSLLMAQSQWCEQHGFNFTPKVLVNGYSYPDRYDVADLPFFIAELMEDETL